MSKAKAKTVFMSAGETGRFDKKTDSCSSNGSQTEHKTSIQSSLMDVALKSERMDEESNILLNEYISEFSTKDELLTLISGIETDIEISKVLNAISLILVGFRQGKAFSLSAMCKGINGVSRDFILNEISNILISIGVFRFRSENKYRWINNEELKDLTKDKLATTKPASWVFSGVIHRINASAMKKRKDRRLREAKIDPWKHIDKNGVISIISREISEADKKLIRTNHELKARAQIVVENHSLSSNEYVSNLIRAEADNALALQKVRQDSVIEITNRSTSNKIKRMDSIGRLKDTVIKVVKFLAVFGAIAIILLILQAVSSVDVMPDDTGSVEVEFPQ